MTPRTTLLLAAALVLIVTGPAPPRPIGTAQDGPITPAPAPKDGPHPKDTP